MKSTTSISQKKELRRTTGDGSITEAGIDMDILTYEYEENTNLLMNVTDNAGSDDANGFLDGNKHLSSGDNDYKYDPNGNMILDRNKGIESVTYNHLNLPVNISFEIGRSIQYTYNAAGQKVKKFVENNGSYEIIDYLDASTQLSTGSFQYAGEVLQYFPTTEGYVAVTPLLNNTTPVAYRFNYVYNYTDHLGNIRVSYTKNPQNGKLKILDENHYYPFGLKHERYLPLEKWKFIIDQQDLEKTKLKVALTDEYLYKYQGQELQDELGLNWYSFKWRNYDPAIARFMSVDPLAEKYNYQSPYNFAENRVVDGRELEGLEWVNANGNQVYDPKSGEYTSHATSNDKALGDGLRNSGDTGATQFNTLVNSTNPIRIERNTTKGADVTEADGGVFKSYQFGHTDSGKEVKSSFKGNELVEIEFKVTQVITINEGTISEFFGDAKAYPNAFKSGGNKEEAGFVKEGMSISEFIIGVLGHEIGHTTKENVMIQIKGGDNEAGPTETGRQIMRDIMKEKKDE